MTIVVREAPHRVGKRTFCLAHAHRDTFIGCHRRCVKRSEANERGVPVNVDVELGDVQRAEKSDVPGAVATDEPEKRAQPTGDGRLAPDCSLCCYRRVLLIFMFYLFLLLMSHKY